MTRSTRDPRALSERQEGYLLAWEFLRRNPAYRAEWEEALARCRVLDCGALHVAEPGEPDPVVGEPVPQDRAADPAFHIPSDEARARWLLDHGYVNPDTEHPRHLLFSIPFGGSAFGAPGSSRVRGPWTGYFPIDFSLPLEPQISRLRSEYRHLHRRLKALGMRSSRPKAHRSKLSLYLRALDSDASGGRWEVVERLDSGAKSAKARKKAGDDLLRQARRMTEPEGYAALLLS
jgi:hypothetical protein